MWLMLCATIFSCLSLSLTALQLGWINAVTWISSEIRSWICRFVFVCIRLYVCVFLKVGLLCWSFSSSSLCMYHLSKDWWIHLDLHLHEFVYFCICAWVFVCLCFCVFVHCYLCVPAFVYLHVFVFASLCSSLSSSLCCLTKTDISTWIYNCLFVYLWICGLVHWYLCICRYIALLLLLSVLSN